MTSKLASALLGSARAARGLLTPLVPIPDEPMDPGPTAEALQSRELEARIEAAIDETLEYHCTHRPPNTARNYAPKQQEWKVSLPISKILGHKADLSPSPSRPGARPRGSPLVGNISLETRLTKANSSSLLGRRLLPVLCKRGPG